MSDEPLKIGTHPNDARKTPPKSGTGVVMPANQPRARIGDNELQGLAKINRVLTEFDDHAIFRMLAWLNCRYDFAGKLRAVRAEEGGQLKPGEQDARD